MKKIVFVILILLVSLSCSAQINRTFLGVTLGVSTKQQVKTIMTQKGYTVTTDPDGSYSIIADNISFGGGMWTYVSFKFVNGYLSEIWFQNNERQSAVNLKVFFDKLKMSLDKKYAAYYFDLPMDNVSKCAHYDDGKTAILLAVRNYHYLEYISIGYEDNALSKKKLQKEEDEL